MANETPNEREATVHLRIAIADLIEDRQHDHSREEIHAFIDAEIARAFGEAA